MFVLYNIQNYQKSIILIVFKSVGLHPDQIKAFFVDIHFKLGWCGTLEVALSGGWEGSLTKWFQLLHHLLPHGLNVDAGEAPLRRHFDEVWPFVAVWKDVAEKLCVVKQVLAVCKIPRPEEGEGGG